MVLTTPDASAALPGDIPARRLGRTLLVLWLLIASGVLVSGLDYYRADAVTRAYSERHELYAPTGRIGHSLGYLGALSIVVGVAGYVLRKRWQALSRVGRLSDWLQVHIFLCTMGPYLVLMHTTFKFGGVAAISFWAMVAAVVSGAVGRYLYAHIPRTIHGNLRTLAALEAEAAEARLRLGDVPPATHAALESAFAAPLSPPRGLVRAVVYAARADWSRRVRMRRARRALGALRVAPRERAMLLELVRSRLRVEQQITLLAPFQRLFHYWHVLHLPVAIVMFLALALHVAVAVAFGYGWPF